MDGKLWVKHFFEFAKSQAQTSYPQDPWKDKAWTEFMGKVTARVAREMGCYPAMRRKKVTKHEYSGEYLNIDAIFFDLKAYDRVQGDWDPFVFPRVVVELENSYHCDRIAYCLWKLCCVRAPLRVLVCYQKGRDKVGALRKYLSAVIRKGGLMEGADKQLLVLIGDDSVSEKSTWKEYYSVFAWQGGRLPALTSL